MKPLSYPQKRYLSAVEEKPGLSRAELGRLLYPEQNPFYSLRRVSKIHKTLAKRGLVELDIIHEGGRLGTQGVYLVGQKRGDDSSYLGIFGKVKVNSHEFGCDCMSCRPHTS